MWKKSILTLSISALVLAGCGKEKEILTDKKQVEDHVFTVAMEKSDAINFESIQASLEKKLKQPVEIKVVSEREKRALLIEGKADIALLSQDEIGFARDEDLIQEVNYEKSTYLSSANEAVKYEGKSYAIPAEFDIPVFAYNSSLMKTPPANLKELIGKGKQEEQTLKQTVTRNDKPKEIDKTTNVVIPPYITYADLGNYNTVYPFLHAFGYSPFKKTNGIYDTHVVNFHTKDVKTAFENIRELTSSFLPIEELSSTKLAELYNSQQLYSFIANKRDLTKIEAPVSFTVIPSIDDKHTYKPIIDIKGWAVAKHVKDKKVISTFASAVSKEKFVQKQILDNGIFTPVKLTWDEQNEYAKTSYEQATHSIALPILAEDRELITPTLRALNWYLTDVNELDDALKNAKQTMEFEIKANY
ncbi:hypothetical protein CN918_32120 [Priestia megaterium]|nr:hypothetical protein CN918_32120 [Priestia megaterium]